ncbi:MAG: hypothetical protein QOH16_3057 [Gaiellaceae bacterium]|nr:hypothetical protein [Gaiellaceae bacterium]
MTHVELGRQVAVPADEVWAMLADHACWPDWSGFDSVDVLRSSRRAETRLITSGDAQVRELIRLDAVRRRFAYRHLDGLPVRYYAGEVTLTANRHGTTIDWRAEIDPLDSRSGAIVGVLGQVLERAIDGLAEAAEARWQKTGFSARCATARR